MDTKTPLAFNFKHRRLVTTMVSVNLSLIAAGVHVLDLVYLHIRATGVGGGRSILEIYCNLSPVCFVYLLSFKIVLSSEPRKIQKLGVILIKFIANYLTC